MNAQSSKDFEKAALEPFGPIRGLGRLESGTLQSVLANAYECRAEITCYKTWDLGEGVFLGGVIEAYVCCTAAGSECDFNIAYVPLGQCKFGRSTEGVCEGGMLPKRPCI